MNEHCYLKVNSANQVYIHIQEVLSEKDGIKKLGPKTVKKPLGEALRFADKYPLWGLRVIYAMNEMARKISEAHGDE